MPCRFLSLLILLVPSLALSQDSVADVRSAFLKTLDRPRVEPDVKLEKTTPQPGGWVLEEFTYASEKKADGAIERVPTILLRPEKPGTGPGTGPMPAVIVLHGTGGNKSGMLAYMRELQAKGIVGVAIDARYHGGRSTASKGADAYNKAIAAAWRSKAGEPMEHPFYYDTVWDLWRLVDVLEKRPDIDAKKIGMIGFSMGGIQTWLAASADQRIAVIVPAIAVQSFKWSLENDQWQGRANTIRLAHETAAKDLGEDKVNGRVCKELWGKVIPGIVDRFDCPSMLRLCAPRPLLILNGTKDANCPIEGARLAIASAKKAYAADETKLEVNIQEVGHTVTEEQRRASIAWFERWLK